MKLPLGFIEFSITGSGNEGRGVTVNVKKIVSIDRPSERDVRERTPMFVVVRTEIQAYNCVGTYDDILAQIEDAA